MSHVPRGVRAIVVGALDPDGTIAGWHRSAIDRREVLQAGGAREGHIEPMPPATARSLVATTKGRTAALEARRRPIHRDAGNRDVAKGERRVASGDVPVAACFGVTRRRRRGLRRGLSGDDQRDSEGGRQPSRLHGPSISAGGDADYRAKGVPPLGPSDRDERLRPRDEWPDVSLFRRASDAGNGNPALG